MLPAACGASRDAPSPAMARAMRLALDQRPAPHGAVAAFYAARSYLPLWYGERGLGPSAAGALLTALRGAGKHGLDVGRYNPDRLAEHLAAVHDVMSAARSDVALSCALAAYGADLRRPAPAADLVYADAGLTPGRLDERAVLESAGRGAPLDLVLQSLPPRHVLYEDLRQAAIDAQTPEARRLARANLERARALPADPGRAGGGRYVLVDAAAARLWMYEQGRPVDGMKVIVGKTSDPTPALSGLIRQVTFQPYWNMPVDLVRRSLAPQVLAEGTGVLAAKDLEVLSDWTPRARPLDPRTVDWTAAARGDQVLRVRQRPGPGNMLGRAKFSFPNRLGIYLHDTPDRSLFAAAGRTRSSGCVRLEDAARFGRWVLGEQAGLMDNPPAGIDVKVAVRRPVPVYITYLTLGPGERGLSRRADVYRRDAAVMAALSDGGSA